MHFFEEHPMHFVYTLYLKTSGQELEPYHINISLLIVKNTGRNDSVWEEILLTCEILSFI